MLRRNMRASREDSHNVLLNLLLVQLGTGTCECLSPSDLAD
jgi:hypothetical protein